MGGWPEEAKPIRSVLTWCGTTSVNQAGRAILAAAADRSAISQSRTWRYWSPSSLPIASRRNHASASLLEAPVDRGNQFRELIRALERQHQAADRAEARHARPGQDAAQACPWQRTGGRQAEPSQGVMRRSPDRSAGFVKFARIRPIAANSRFGSPEQGICRSTMSRSTGFGPVRRNPPAQHDWGSKLHFCGRKSSLLAIPRHPTTGKMARGQRGGGSGRDLYVVTELTSGCVTRKAGEPRKMPAAA
jgi:hypothetical protein